VSSALGLWLLLALVAPAAQGEEREQLQDALGCPVRAAVDYADQLLGTPATAVALAAAAWDTPRTRSLPAYASWTEGLPAVVERGDVPDQAAADRWARRHTAGIIDAFPLKLDPTVVLVLANALATRVTWSHPFRLQPAWWLGGPWAEHVGTVLPPSRSTTWGWRTPPPAFSPGTPPTPTACASCQSSEHRTRHQSSFFAQQVRSRPAPRGR